MLKNIAPEGTHICVILDTCLTSLNLEKTLESVIYLLNAHLSLCHSNSVSLFANSTLLSPCATQSSSNPPSINFDFWNLLNQVNSSLVNLSHNQEYLAKSLSKALLLLNSYSNLEKRIIVISSSNDIPTLYVPVMNSIFAAQKLSIAIDVVAISNQFDRSFLQQAANITNGIFLVVDDVKQLLPVLIYSFLPDVADRDSLGVVGNDTVDFKTVCFCCSNAVSIGFVCSICLSVFCNSLDICLTCKTVFKDKDTKMVDR